jgi:hypothetical protein
MTHTANNNAATHELSIEELDSVVGGVVSVRGFLTAMVAGAAGGAAVGAVIGAVAGGVGAAPGAVAGAAGGASAAGIGYMVNGIADYF